ncbi:MAG: amino acid adenylation domain-containing protein, partial [bacterium]|nr:amino acid adenylation domain-containing protein [bacterium]
WREQLAGLPMLDLPTDRPRPAVQSFRGASQPFRLPAALGRELQELSRKHGTTLFMTLLAAFQALLGRFSGQSDLAVGTPIAGRTQAELEGLLGFFVNTLVLRGSLSGDPSFGELLARVRETALGAYAHQDVPFESLVEALDPERNLSQNPLAQVLFLLQNAPAGTADFGPELRVGIEGVATGEAKFDLTLGLVESGEGGLEYNVDLFDASTIRRLLGHFRILLEAAVSLPERRLSQLSVLPGVEQQQLLREWNDTRSRLATATLHGLFEARVAAVPDAVALVCGGSGPPDGRLSYAELERRANRLAHDLRSLGVGPEVAVGLCAERTPELVVGILAILKAGGFYVPLDPGYPKERIAFMLEDGGVRVLLTQERLLAVLPEHRARVICLDADHRGIAEPGAVTPAATAGNLAYAIYTSGSTGRPKGVAIEHRHAVAMVAWAWEEFPAAELAGVLASTSICFDLSIFELFVPLARGGKVILAANALELPALPAASEVTLINTVPSAMTELVRMGGIPPSARTVNLAGEPLKNRLVQLIYEQETVARVLNLYGPSEDTTYSTWATVPRGWTSTPPIGRPVANGEAYVLDQRMQPVPLGVPGELFMAGAGVVRGYLERPQLTAERFLPDPFGAAGSRLYRTGDLARYLPDGRLDFLGRLDHQVKIRGFRIELREIEILLGEHPGLREAAVATRDDSAGDKSLVAYVVASGAAAPAVAELRAFLAVKLPDYMVPSRWVELPSLPLTPNGKIDRAALGRRALPAPEPVAAGPDGSGRTPRDPVERDPVEEILVGIYSELFGGAEPASRRVDVDANFFTLGGHSLLATRLTSRVRRALGVEVPLRAVFEVPTPAGLAGYVNAALRREEGLEAPPIDRVEPRDRPLPLSFAQQRLWFIDRFEPGSALYNIPTHLLLEGRLEVVALDRALGEIVRRHEVLRTRFGIEDGEPVQWILPELELPVPVLELSGLGAPQRRTEARRLGLAVARRPFDLARGPLLRAVLLRLGPQQHALVVTVHHIAFDGWSGGVFLGELAALYQAFSGPGAVSPLPELPVQYADFAVWQRQWLAGEVLERQLAYWRRQLHGLPVLELPTDRPRPVMQSFRGAAESFRLASADLNALGRKEGTTLYMTLLAIFQALLHRHTGQQDLAVGSVVANRRRIEIEPLLGFFINTLVLRGDLRGNPTFRELLARMREVALGAYAHQDVPFEKLVEELDPERDLSRNPLVQVVFVLQNAPAAPPDLIPGLTATLDSVDAAGEAKFDLSVVLWEAAGELVGTAEYGTDLFDAATIRRLMGHFRCLAEGVAADPVRRLSELPLMSAGEQWQLLGEW